MKQKETKMHLGVWQLHTREGPEEVKGRAKIREGKKGRLRKWYEWMNEEVKKKKESAKE